MDAFECIATRLEIKDFSDRDVPGEVIRKILEAARLSPSGINSQHWRFIVVKQKERIKQLASISTTGKWVENANFAIIVITDPRYNFHLIDAGRVIQDMQLAAWNYGVASRIYTGFDRKAMHDYFNIPENLNIAAVVGFGYPGSRVLGKKNRKELKEIAYSEKFGHELVI